MSEPIQWLSCPNPDCDANYLDAEEQPVYEHADWPSVAVRVSCACGLSGPWASTFEEADRRWNDIGKGDRP